jgi:hypothetical protein
MMPSLRTQLGEASAFAEATECHRAYPKTNFQHLLKALNNPTNIITQRKRNKALAPE